MNSADAGKMIRELQREVAELKSALADSEETLRAIRHGEVDAIVVSGDGGDKIFSLESSETPYRTIIEEIEEGAVTILLNGTILYCNIGFSNIIGLPLEKVIGANIADFFEGTDKEKLFRLIAKGRKKPVNGNVTVKREGEDIYLRVSLVPLPANMQGDVCIVVSDISEIRNYQNHLQEMIDDRTSELRVANRRLHEDVISLRKIENALQQSRERYALAIGAAHIGTWDHYLSSPRKYTWSDQMKKIHGLDPRVKLNTRIINSLVHREDRDYVSSVFSNDLNSGESFEIEYRVSWKDGSVHWVHTAGKSLEPEHGISRVIGISYDITLRKNTELALRESEERFRLLSETMLQGVIYRNSEGLITSVNPAAERIIGKPESELIGRINAIEMFREDGSIIPPEEHPALKTLRSGKVLIGEVIRIFNASEKEERWVSLDTIPLFNDDRQKPSQVYSVFSDITERRQYEKELLKREQLFKSAFNEGAVPMALTSKAGMFLQVNHAFCKLTGYSEQELKTLSFQDITHPDDLAISSRGRLELVNRERNSFRVEKRYLRKDGKPVWVSVSTAPVRDEKGDWDFFVTHVQDINQRKIAESRLKESKERFKQLANSIPQLAWIARADGYIYWINQRWYEYTGKSPDDVVGWNWQKLLERNVRQAVTAQYKSFIEAGKPFEIVSSIRGADGSYREFLTKGIPITDENGDIEQWFGSHTDISAIIKAENELKKSREKLRLALENGQIGTWEYDIKTGIIECDDRMLRMHRLNPEEFDGSVDSFLGSLHEEDVPHSKEASSVAATEGQTFEIVYRTKPVGGESSYISTKGVPVFDEQGKLSGISGVSFDVTGMKKGAERVLIRLNEDLLRSNTDLQQFAYVASHDLQEPLRMVSSFTQLLQQRYGDKLDADAREFIHFAVEGSKRMYELLNGLLTYSRIQTRSREFVPVNMESVLKNVKENLRLAISEKNAVITSSTLPVISADENQMIQLLQNLVENSLKFTTRKPEIHFSHREENGNHVFCISDNGIGIEPQYSERIFRIFQRLHHTEEYGGTGIGLAICKRIVERHGGRISVESVKGEGSTFCFSIPFGLNRREN